MVLVLQLLLVLFGSLLFPVLGRLLVRLVQLLLVLAVLPAPATADVLVLLCCWCFRVAGVIGAAGTASADTFHADDAVGSASAAANTDYADDISDASVANLLWCW